MRPCSSKRCVLLSTLDRLLTPWALQLHDKVIDDTVKGVRAEFLEQGVDPLAIDELKEVRKGHFTYFFLSFSALC